MSRTEAKAKDSLRLEVDAVKAWLMTHFPVESRRVIVLLRPRGQMKFDGKSAHSTLDVRKKSFVIKLARGDWRYVCLDLVHEWAHCRIYPLGMDDDPHLDIEEGMIRRKYLEYRPIEADGAETIAKEYR